MFTDKEFSDYEESLHNLWDISNAMSDAEEKGFGKGIEQGRAEGIEQGRAEGRAEGAKAQAIETARQMKSDGVPVDTIAKYTHLSIDEITTL